MNPDDVKAASSAIVEAVAHVGLALGEVDEGALSPLTEYFASRAHREGAEAE